MFKAREKYAREERIPREEIQKWNEVRMLIILAISISLYTLLSIIVIFCIQDNSYFIASFWIGGVFTETGRFKAANTIYELYNNALAHYMLIQFVEVLALFWAIPE